jgi:ribosomal protein S21
MAEEESASTSSRRSRGAGGTRRSASSTRRGRVDGAELIDTLNEMVSQLITENRQLKRQLASLSGRSPESPDGDFERTLRSLHRKVERAVSAAAPRRRRSSSSAPSPARRRTRTRTAAAAEQ